LTQAIKLKFRKGIVVDLLDEWLPRAYRLTYAGAIGAIRTSEFTKMRIT
jgi:hypothetical protein